MAWRPIGRASDFEAQGPFAANADGVDLVVVRSPRGLKVFEGRCPHQGALLGEGEMEDSALVCRNHRWRFDPETGKRKGGAQCLHACPSREAGGMLEVDASDLGARVSDKTARRKLSDLPSLPTLPIVGSAYLFDPSSMHIQLEEWGKKLGFPFRYRFGPYPAVAFGDAQTNLAILRDRPETFRRAANVEPIFRELGVAGVFSAEGQKWRPQRRLSMEALSHRHLRGFYPALATVAERLRARWTKRAESGDVLDLCDELKRFTVDVTTQLVFGYDINTLEQDGDVIQRKLELIFPTFNRRLFSVIPWWRIVRMPADRRVDRAIAELRVWIDGLVAKAREKNAEVPSNFLEAMIAARDEEGKPFADEVIFGNLMTMLLAGEDTTAYTLAWAVHHLVDSPGDIGALRAELDSVMGHAHVPKSIEDTNRLAWAGAIANESMRLRPVAPAFFNEAASDTIVDGVEIPKGTMVVVMVRPAATNPEHFGDPEAFRPARWIDQSAGAHEPSASYPFGSGPRICPGRSLALLEMKLVLATLYKSFDVERVSDPNEVREKLAFTMMPSKLEVRLRKRAVARAAASSPEESGAVAI